MGLIIGIIIVIILGDVIFKPRIDHTPEGKAFLYFWWGRKRKSIELW